VAFLGIEAGVRDEDPTRATRKAREGVRGGDKGSARAKADNAAVAVTFDPAVTSLREVVAAANRPLARRGVTLSALRVIDGGGKLREP
jgi:hypothetical protein